LHSTSALGVILFYYMYNRLVVRIERCSHYTYWRVSVVIEVTESNEDVHTTHWSARRPTSCVDGVGVRQCEQDNYFELCSDSRRLSPIQFTPQPDVTQLDRRVVSCRSWCELAISAMWNCQCERFFTVDTAYTWTTPICECPCAV